MPEAPGRLHWAAAEVEVRLGLNNPHQGKLLQGSAVCISHWIAFGSLQEWAFPVKAENIPLANTVWKSCVHVNFPQLDTEWYYKILNTKGKKTNIDTVSYHFKLTNGCQSSVWNYSQWVNSFKIQDFGLPLATCEKSCREGKDNQLHI